jgi:hypothetical protein
MLKSDFNNNLQDLIDSSLINSDYANTYTSEYDYTSIDQVTNVQTISGETNTGETFDLDLTITFNLIDDLQPTFIGSTSNMYVSNAVLYDDFASLITAQDETDVVGDLTVTLFHDGYTANYTTPGSYQVIYSAEDTSGNIGFHTINVYVVDQSPPIYSFDSELVVVTENEPITEENLTSVLEAYGIVVTELSFTPTIITETYFGRESDIGFYTMQLQIDYEDGSMELIELEIQVVEELSVQTPSEPWFDFKNPFIIAGSFTSLGIVALALVIITKKRK